MENKKTEEISAIIKERFKDKYPVINEKFKEWMPPFVSWVVEQTIMELE